MSVFSQNLFQIFSSHRIKFLIQFIKLFQLRLAIGALPFNCGLLWLFCSTLFLWFWRFRWWWGFWHFWLWLWRLTERFFFRALVSLLSFTTFFTCFFCWLFSLFFGIFFRTFFLIFKPMQFIFNVFDDIIKIFLLHSVNIINFLFNFVLLNFKMSRFELEAF